MSMTIEMLSQRVEILEKQMATLLADTSTKSDDKKVKNTKPDDKPAKKTKKADKEDKPKKKRVSGYLLFSCLLVMRLQELFGDDKPKNSEIMVELGKRWKALEDEEREEWNRQAKEAASEESAEEEE